MLFRSYSTPGKADRVIVPPQEWKPEGMHAVENLGDTPAHAIRVELKLADPDAAVSTP